MVQWFDTARGEYPKDRTQTLFCVEGTWHSGRYSRQVKAFRTLEGLKFSPGEKEIQWAPVPENVLLK